MSPQELLTPVVFVLAFIGYVACFERMFWLTLAGSVALAGLLSQSFEFSVDNSPYWGAGAAVALLAALAGRYLRGHRPVATQRARTGGRESADGVVIDGTNVMYWDGEADLRTLRAVVDKLRSKGLMPFVFLDASSRHHLGDPSLDEKGFARALGLKRNRIMVCPARTEADAFILKFAREHQLPVVSNDRFGDRAEQAKGLQLIKGGIAGGKPILHGI